MERPPGLARLRERPRGPRRPGHFRPRPAHPGDARQPPQGDRVLDRQGQELDLPAVRPGQLRRLRRLAARPHHLEEQVAQGRHPHRHRVRRLRRRDHQGQDGLPADPVPAAGARRLRAGFRGAEDRRPAGGAGEGQSSHADRTATRPVGARPGPRASQPSGASERAHGEDRLGDRPDGHRLRRPPPQKTTANS